MNYIKRPLCPTTNVRDPITAASLTKTKVPLNGAVHFNDAMSIQKKSSEREKYLTA